MITVLSSAKSIENKSSDVLEKSYINAIKTRRPRIKPWGTPYVINVVSDLLLYIVIPSLGYRFVSFND